MTKFGEWKNGNWIPNKEGITRLDQFLKLEESEKKSWLSQEGNKIWKESKELMQRKRFITQCQNSFFGWKREEEE